MNRVLITICTVVVLTLSQVIKAEPIPGEKVGVVLMHGKWGIPKHVSSVANTLRRAGAIVVTPVMPWSRNRAYAKSYEDSMKEIDVAVERLRRKGAKRIFVGGHSMGANAALGYGARRDGLAGLILLAPGHVPGLHGFDKKVAKSVDKARTMVSAGKGGKKTRFGDLNQTRIKYVSTTAEIYLSWFEPDGPAVMEANAINIPGASPLAIARLSRTSKAGY